MISGINARAPPEPYYGRAIGQFTDFAHGIKVRIMLRNLKFKEDFLTILFLLFQGNVYAIDESTLFIKNFAYDGTGPDAFFWVGNSPRPSPEGYIIPYPEEYSGR